MSVRRKLFAAMAAFILAMGLLFAAITQVIVKDMLRYMIDVDRTPELEELSTIFADSYRVAGNTWDEAGALDAGRLTDNGHAGAGLLLTDAEGQPVLRSGEASDELARRLGLAHPVQADGETVGRLYYYDREVMNMSKLRYGVGSSVSFLLLAGAILFVGLSLVVAYWLAGRLTAPLRGLLPVIDRLGRGDFGAQTEVAAKDEYGKVAEAINDMSRQLKRAEEVRRNLVMDVAHELRTPLTIMSGKLELIQQSGQAVRPEELLPLQDELFRLTRLVEDLRVLSLAEARRLPLEKRPTDIVRLLERIVERAAPEAEAKAICVALDDRTDGEAVIDADAHRLTQVFLNLLVNAVRYTPPDGSVAVVVETPEAGRGERKRLRVTVADTGIGIAPEHLPLLFDRFYRAEEARSRHGGGTGLGLAIAKEFVLAHGGAIDAQSEPGRGTRIVVTLPG